MASTRRRTDGARRIAGLSRILFSALAHRTASIGRRRPPEKPRRILVAHHLLLGDTLMLTPLLAKLRERFPDAEIVMAVPEAHAGLYANRPYGVQAIGWNGDLAEASLLWPQRGFDLAYVPADNRFSWLALALGARWIVAFSGDRPAYKSWPVDEERPYPDAPTAWSDMNGLLVDGPPPQRYSTRSWQPPAVALTTKPERRYAVLHVGASTPLKCWQPERWLALADWFHAQGIEPVWSGGRGEEPLVAACDPDGRYRSYAGKLSLPELWHLLAGAEMLVSPDTGVSHLGRVVGVPTVTLFGPGSHIVNGAGDFWADAPLRAVTVDPFPCRDQHDLFKRDVIWVRRCGRSTAECSHPRCMDEIDLAKVTAAIVELQGLAQK